MKIIPIAAINEKVPVNVRIDFSHQAPPAEISMA
jgi:hypothetical protein